MKLREIIAGQKSDVQWAQWKDTPPKRADLPCSSRRRGAFPLTRRWRWTTVAFSVATMHFRILVAYHVDVPEYKAVLAQVIERDSRIIARFEYHGTHPGWHFHANCSDIGNITPGIVVPSGVVRVPQSGVFHRKISITVDNSQLDDKVAEAIAARKYKIPYTEDMIVSARLP